jgi:hypothetical protein
VKPSVTNSPSERRYIWIIASKYLFPTNCSTILGASSSPAGSRLSYMIIKKLEKASPTMINMIKNPITALEVSWS